MTSNSRITFSLLVALCIAGASATDHSSFFADIQASSRVSKVRTASYYGYGQTDLSCLSQINFKSCRYTGCPECVADQSTGAGGDDNDGSDEADVGLTNLFFQTDFTCCPKEHSYGYDSKQDVGQLGYSDKVGTCDWEISFYRWPAELGNVLAGPTEVAPVLTDDRTALKWGTAWGTCYLNAEAEHCDHPLCERMAISIQGGLYASLAYGDSTTISLPAFEETCSGGLPNWYPTGANGGRIMAKQADAGAKQDLIDPPIPASANPVGTLFNFVIQYSQLILSGRGFELLPEKRSLVVPCPEVNGVKPLICSRNQAKRAPAQAKTADAEEATKLYPGIAVIISGPFYVTQKHGDKYEETGLFEFSPFFIADEDAQAVSEPTSKWPVVRQKGAKLRFTKDKDGYSQESYGYDNKYEQKYDDKYSGDKEYYERKEYHRER